jgi:hypothetical protein
LRYSRVENHTIKAKNLSNKVLTDHTSSNKLINVMQRANFWPVLLLALTALAACCSAAYGGAERLLTKQLRQVTQHSGACVQRAKLALGAAHVHPSAPY